jgi:diguanylate cyclase (GGDEF)-like protein/PAS domain S-box-containing protein
VRIRGALTLVSAISAALGCVASHSAFSQVLAASPQVHINSPDLNLLLIMGGLAAANVVLTVLAWNRHRAFAEMRRAQQAFRDLYDNISEGVFRSTLDGRMLSANPSLVRLNGYTSEAEMLASVNNIADEWYVDPNRRAEINQILTERGSVSKFVSEIYRYKTRERIWVEENTRLVRDAKSGEPLCYEGTIREVTETVRRLDLQEHYSKIASIVSGCLFRFRLKPDGSSCMPYASVGLVHLFGLQPDRVRNDASAVFDFMHPDDLAPLKASIERSATSLTPWQWEFRVCVPGQPEKWVFGHSVPEREADGSTLWHGYLTDISERKRSEAKIYDLAYFDPLTRLPNRTMLRERLEQVIRSGTDRTEWNAVLFIDLDQFKVLNDSKGHHVGDLLLCEVAARLQRQIGRGDLVARLGGDEFVILLQGLGVDRDAAEMQVAEFGSKILATTEQPYNLDLDVFHTSASIGAAMFRAEGCDLDELLKCADLAMYEAKAAGRNDLRFFEPAMRQQIEDRVALTADLREAISESLLSLCYQPQVDRAGFCFGVEALLRWDHRERGFISPPEIVALAERQGLINPLEEWVLQAACLTLKAWAADPLTRNLKLAVNVTAHQLNRRGFIDAVKDALQSTGADPSRLSLELTEHVMLDAIDEVSGVMLELKALGIGFALDDFGTGYSSLSYLKRLPIDALKIDRSFVRDIEVDPSDREIVQTIVNIAASLRVAVVAEGVETEMQALLLRQMGCDFYQGYLFGKPMSSEALLTYLREQAASSIAAFRPRPAATG